MSENDNPSPAPTKQTSSVPLKKETVRVTLKAADAPPAVPSATVPMAPPVRPPVPTGAPMAPPRPTAPAPTIPLRTAGAPTAPVAAPTIRLATSAAPISPGATTGALKPPGAPTMGGTPTLPKATVQLQAPTQPLGTSFPSTPPQTGTFQMDEDEEVEAHATLFNILSGLGFAAALAVLAFQLMIANTWISASDNPNPGGWSQLFE